MSNERSNLIDVTYERIHAWLNGQFDSIHPSSLPEQLKPRIPRIRDIANPFGTPSDASKAKIKSGKVTLDDGVSFQIEDVDKDLVFAISDKFHIDEVEAFVLLRSFLYNEPSSAYVHGSTTSPSRSVVDEWIEAITPFYYSQRLFIMRILPPLFRAMASEQDPLFAIAQSILPNIIPDGRAFADTLLAEYAKKCTLDIPSDIASDPRAATRWAKQNYKEQLATLEVLFWTVWDYAPCDGPLVSRVLELSYEYNLGSKQRNATLLLDDESMQLQQDCAATWILITVEVLELEKIADPDGVLEISADPKTKDFYVSDPESLTKIHNLITSHRSTQYAITYLAWAFVLSRIVATAKTLKEIPDGYRTLFDTISTSSSGSSLFSKEREPVHMLMASTCLDPEVGLFKLMHSLLTTSPLFVTSIAIKTGSSIITPNVVASRSVFKGLLIALLELVPVERIPDFDGLLEVWIALFGRSEAHIIRGITRQFWSYDMHIGRNRRAILDVARSRFPIQFRPLVRLLRSLSGAGFLDTDPLSSGQHHWPDVYEEGEGGDRDFCGRCVYHYLAELSTYSQVIPVSACTGAHAVFEKVHERYGGANGSLGLTYVNLRPVKLPGGSTLPVKSSGKLLSDEDKDFIVVAWMHEHSGWKVILEVLTEYVNRRRIYSASGHHHQDVSFARRGAAQTITLKMEDIGMEMDPTGDEGAVTDALDLVRGVIQGNSLLASELLSSLESGDHVVAHTMVEASPPDLVQLTTMILEEALSRGGPTVARAHAQDSTKTQLITSAMGVLSALLDLPGYSDRVWLYMRSTAALFGSDRSSGFASVALEAERVTGTYTMTLALLRLVQKLFVEASASTLYVQMHAASLQRVKEEVLIRAARFVHSEIWVEHLGWKYAQLADRFVIGHLVTAFFADIMAHVTPPGRTTGAESQPFVALCQAVADAFLYKATTSTVNPLVSAIAGGGSLLKMLHGSRRYGDCGKLRQLLKSHLTLTRLVLNYKHRSPVSNKLSLLEQALCARVTGGATSLDTRSKVDPIDVVAGYAKSRFVGDLVRHEAVRTLYSLCSSLSLCQPSPPTIIGHLSDPEATVASLVRIVQHPYDELSLRIAVWNFISLAIHKEPALASLFVTGQSRIPADLKGKGKETDEKATPGSVSKSLRSSALEVAKTMLGTWKTLWDHNPPLLASVLKFLDVVWQHGLEHKAALEPTRSDATFWTELSDIVNTELGSAPDYHAVSLEDVDGVRRADSHQAVSNHAYRTAAKSFALHLIGLDIELQLQGQPATKAVSKPLSFSILEPTFKTESKLTALTTEAVPNSYDPSLHDNFVDYISTGFPPLSLDQLESQEPTIERDFGDDYTFSTALLQTRLSLFQTGNGESDQLDVVDKQLRSINLNLSLSHPQAALVESWQFLLRKAVPFVRKDAAVRHVALSIAATLSSDIAREARSGDMVATIHGGRLSLLLSLLEVAWFSASDQVKEVKSFISLVDNVHGIILNEVQPPSKSVLGMVTNPFHRTLLQIMFFCAKHCRNLARRPNVLSAEQRLTIATMLEVNLTFTVDALRVVFDSARTRVDVELDRDMQFLVAVFDQCTRPDIGSSSSFWLARCIETDVIKSSLSLFVSTDLVGLSDLPLLLSRKQPLYAPHVLMFHMSLSSIPAAAERLAGEGVLTAYSDNVLSTAIKAGMIDVTLPEFPGDRSPAHRAYCSMLAIVAGVIGALGRHNHYFDTEASGFVHLYGDQISRALSWTVGETITLPLVEEIQQVVNVFAAIANSAPTTAKADPTMTKVLRVFTARALLLLQQLNYALTHPNHLASLLEPVTAEERMQAESSSREQDVLKRILVIRLVDQLFQLSSAILSALVTISRADNVLIEPQEDWPSNEALLIPHSKVVLGEPASLGTLLELGNCTLDRLRDLSGRPPASKATDAYNAAYATAQRNLELIMVYSVTQLAMWLCSPESDALGGGGAPGGDMDVEEGQQLSESQRGGDAVAPRDRKVSRASATLAERLRRGMASEMADDLESLLKRGKAVLQGAGADSKQDLAQILLNFFKDHLSN